MKNSCMYSVNVYHHRLRPKAHRFVYKVSSWLIDLDELDELDQSLRYFSRNKPNWLSFYDKDYGDGSITPLKQQVCQQLLAHNIELPDRVSLLCFPRMLGYSFNPLSVYFCYNRNNVLLAVLYEVSNTFDERHTYIIPCYYRLEDLYTIRQRANKKMHVSPFMAMDYCYGFRVKPPKKSLSIAINMKDADGIVFFASMTGERLEISNKGVLKQFIKMPLMTFKVMFGILWEAARLYFKGLKVYRYQPKAERVSSSLGDKMTR
ncbi:MAG: DUF1365 domain-containing protein [Endozoicomonas sp. (ex Botrylloides leachii)]|nr:DUF1365 domain-containing protein [Endozoicomonas sp. (ex Botrylloides leachii)]